MDDIRKELVPLIFNLEDILLTAFKENQLCLRYPVSHVLVFLTHDSLCLFHAS